MVPLLVTRGIVQKDCPGGLVFSRHTSSFFCWGTRRAYPASKPELLPLNSGGALGVGLFSLSVCSAAASIHQVLILLLKCKATVLVTHGIYKGGENAHSRGVHNRGESPYAIIAARRGMKYCGDFHRFQRWLSRPFGSPLPAPGGNGQTATSDKPRRHRRGI